MTIQPLNPLPTISRAEFRQQLAGFVIPARAAPLQVYRDTAARIVCLLAAHYNRDVLDPLKLWNRIETAVRAGIEKRTGDAGAFLSGMLETVQADGAAVARDAEFAALVEELNGRSAQWIDGLVGYFRDATYAALMLGRHRWEAVKRERGGRPTIEDEAAGRELGERPSGLFPEDQVAQAMKQRSNHRKGDQSDE